MRKASLARPTRKEFLKLGLAGGVALALPFGASCCSSGDQTGALLRSSAPLPEPFSLPLPVPPVLEPVRTDASTDYYELTQREGQRRFCRGSIPRSGATTGSSLVRPSRPGAGGESWSSSATSCRYRRWSTCTEA
jgi:hypothetical protein